MELADILGGGFSRFQLTTGAYYLCRRDFFEFIEAGKGTTGWFSVLVGDTTDHTEVRGWRKTGRPQPTDRSVTELNTVRCIIHGPESDHFYKIAEMSKPSFVNESGQFTSNIHETMKSVSLERRFQIGKNIESRSEEDSKDFHMDKHPIMTGKMNNTPGYVKCPRCRNVLPEPREVPVYKCGACDATLQSRSYKIAETSMPSSVDETRQFTSSIPDTMESVSLERRFQIGKFIQSRSEEDSKGFRKGEHPTITVETNNSKSPFVLCPRCRIILSEPPKVPVYKCGACGAKLRAGMSRKPVSHTVTEIDITSQTVTDTDTLSQTVFDTDKTSQTVTDTDTFSQTVSTTDIAGPTDTYTDTDTDIDIIKPK
ncbi:hypothetical protein L1987_59515 [Smallanthus sonchifolius]|uniref:Uncharacterized protein n=1 Tax=Smallanthus sonchifolius TaxID=185202 RepID=A0ACB9D6B8_9ASTR|nr:hypothetical protein L1987_59515 [Smallanthus sonchifolius]